MGRRFPGSTQPCLHRRHGDIEDVKQPNAAMFPQKLGSVRLSETHGPLKRRRVAVRYYLMVLCVSTQEHETYLLKHKSKFYSFFWDALHIQKAVELEVELPFSFLLLFFTPCQSGNTNEEGQRSHVMYSSFICTILMHVYIIII